MSSHLRDDGAIDPLNSLVKRFRFLHLIVFQSANEFLCMRSWRVSGGQSGCHWVRAQYTVLACLACTPILFAKGIWEIASYVSDSSSKEDWYSNSLRIICMTSLILPTALMRSEEEKKKSEGGHCLLRLHHRLNTYGRGISWKASKELHSEPWKLRILSELTVKIS